MTEKHFSSYSCTLESIDSSEGRGCVFSEKMSRELDDEMSSRRRSGDPRRLFSVEDECCLFECSDVDSESE